MLEAVELLLSTKINDITNSNVGYYFIALLISTFNKCASVFIETNTFTLIQNCVVYYIVYVFS